MVWRFFVSVDRKWDIKYANYQSLLVGQATCEFINFIIHLAAMTNWRWVWCLLDICCVLWFISRRLNQRQKTQATRKRWIVTRINDSFNYRNGWKMIALSNPKRKNLQINFTTSNFFELDYSREKEISLKFLSFSMRIEVKGRNFRWICFKICWTFCREMKFKLSFEKFIIKFSRSLFWKNCF